jgi:hypothetical protein
VTGVSPVPGSGGGRLSIAPEYSSSADIPNLLLFNFSYASFYPFYFVWSLLYAFLHTH